ncbi:monocarboxylate transporter 12-B-like [Haliotis rufescens]|uniref:monocarboxylate transporter 12-B-like n=1 Tax=Haliotis rufescens TaxID=6454 RepID=UPI00201F48DF|nr:monocarboxylate transporter 12-B-like [Haliotis rufescens]
MDSDEECVPADRYGTAYGPESLEAEVEDFSINIIGASSEEEEDVFVRNRLSKVHQHNDVHVGESGHVAMPVTKTTDVQMGETDDSHLPIDGGWAWMILAGCFLNVIIMIGYARGMAILFVEYLTLFEASTTKTTLLMGVMAGVYSLSSLISMHVLVDLLGVRKTVMLGATITTAAMVMAIFPTSITYLICTHSAFIGLGHSMIYGPAIVLIGHYFNKRRGLATAIAMSGISFGSSVFPPLIRYLLDEYGLQGSMIILTGITMNMWVGGMVNRPLESYRKMKTTANTKQNGHAADTKLNRRSLRADMKHFGKLNPEKFLSVSSITSEMIGRSPLQGYSLLNTGVPDSPTLVRRISRPLSGTSQISFNLYASNAELGSVSVLSAEDEDEAFPKVDENSEKDTVTSKNAIFYMKKVLSTLEFSLFKNPVFVLIILYSFFGITIGLVPVYLPALAKDKDISQSDAAIFLLISGAIDFFSRLFYGFLADTKIMRVTTIMAIGLIITGTMTHLTFFFNSYVTLLIYSVVYGMFASSYFCLIPVAIVDLLGLQYMAKTLGFVSLFHGVSMAITHPIVGSLTDCTGSYTAGFNYLGACAYTSAIVLLCVPLLTRHVTRHLNEKTLNENKEEIKPLQQTTEL